MTKFIYFVVYRHVLFYISVGAGYIGFGLIVIVIRHEKFNAVFGKKFAHLVAQLSGKRFVVRKDERGTIYGGDYVCHRKCFSAAGYAQQHLTFKP